MGPHGRRHCRFRFIGADNFEQAAFATEAITSSVIYVVKVWKLCLENEWAEKCRTKDFWEKLGRFWAFAALQIYVTNKITIPKFSGASHKWFWGLLQKGS